MNFLSTLRARLHKAHPDHHLIARGMAWVAFFVLLGSFARAAREMAIAYRYGVSAEVDAYLFVFNLVSWPVAVWLSVLTVVLVPLAAQIRHSAPEELPLFRAELLGLSLMIGLALTVVAAVGLPLLLRSSWTGLPPSVVILANQMAPVLLPLAPLGILIGLFSVWMLAAGRHANTLLEGIPAFVVLAALLAFPGGGTEPLVWGTLAGFIFHLASIATPQARRGEVDAPRISRRSAQWPAFWQGFGIMLVGQVLMSFTAIIDQFFAAHIGTGAIATLSYANRILALMLGMGAMAVSRATMPVFSQSHAQGGGQHHGIATHWARLMFVLGLGTMILCWWLAPWMVALLFERGAFTAVDTVVVAEVFRYGALQMPFYFAGLVLVSLLVSKGKYRIIAAVAGINFVVKVGANLVFVNWFGLNGIVLATAFMYMVSLSLCWIAVRRTA